jgi:hypothetical protein
MQAFLAFDDWCLSCIAFEILCEFFSFQLELKEERSNSESEVVFRIPQTLLLTLFLRYNPFGRPGAGAPLRDTGGRIIAVLSACFECYMRVSAHAA